MDLFGIGGPELLVLMLLGAVILGPQRIAVVAREAGKFVRQIQDIARNLTKEMNKELDLLEREERQRTREQASSASTAGGIDAQPPELPEAYQRFREDFPEEGDLEDSPAVPQSS